MTNITQHEHKNNAHQLSNFSNMHLTIRVSNARGQNHGPTLTLTTYLMLFSIKVQHMYTSSMHSVTTVPRL
jgi:hypothetical protein